MNIGIENPNFEKMKNLKEGTLLFSAEFVSPENVVEPSVYIFDGYVNSPKKEGSDSIWAKLKKCKVGSDSKIHKIVRRKSDNEMADTIIVEDISCGIFTSYEECLIEFEKMIETIRHTIHESLERERSLKEMQTLEIGDPVEICIEEETSAHNDNDCETKEN